MVETLTKYAKSKKPIGKGTLEIVTLNPLTHEIIVAEVRVKSNAIHLENIAKK